MMPLVNHRSHGTPWTCLNLFTWDPLAQAAGAPPAPHHTETHPNMFKLLHLDPTIQGPTSTGQVGKRTVGLPLKGLLVFTYFYLLFKQRYISQREIDTLTFYQMSIWISRIDWSNIRNILLKSLPLFLKAIVFKAMRVTHHK